MKDAEARFQEAVDLLEKGRPIEADAICIELLKLLPDAATVIFLRGLIASRVGEMERAVSMVSEAVRRDPANASFQATLGAFLVESGEGARAVPVLEKVLDLNPNDRESARHLARQHFASGQASEALSLWRRVTSSNAAKPEDWISLGDVLDAANETHEALEAYAEAARLRPGYMGALNRLGAAQLKLGLLGDGIASFEASMAIQFEDNPATVGLFAMKQLACDWREFDGFLPRVEAMTQAAVAAGQVSFEDPFLHIIHCDDPARNFAVAQAWSRALERSAAAVDVTFAHTPRDAETIRIGYLSSDFHDHATAHLMLGLFAAHDRSQFSIHAYSCGPDDGSTYRQKIEKDCDSFVDIAGMDAREAARRIHDDGIDILVDLKGYTRHHRLDIAALRPCPVQVTWLGFPGTSGAGFFDYVITDDIVTPPDHAAFYSEALAVMPHCYQINNDQQEISEDEITRSDAGLPEDSIVFASFNNTYKLEPVMFATWMDILKAVPDSVLWLLVNNPRAAENLRREAGAAGVDPDRLIFADMMPKPMHLKRMALADLVLDTRIYNGHTTTSDALWAGVPVLALRGTHFASRVSASILTAFSLPELVVETLDDYREIALVLAARRERLAELKQKTANLGKDTLLFDTGLFAQQLERGYAEMWRRYKAGEPVGNLRIADL